MTYKGKKRRCTHPETNNLLLKMDGWTMNFLWGWPNFRGENVSFREGIHLVQQCNLVIDAGQSSSLPKRYQNPVDFQTNDANFFLQGEGTRLIFYDIPRLFMVFCMISTLIYFGRCFILMISFHVYDAVRITWLKIAPTLREIFP